MSGEAEKPPVSDYYELLDFRTYHHTSKRWVSLCVVRDRHGKFMKLYDWQWKGEEKGWKLSLANMNVVSVNLRCLASDAAELAALHNININWA